MPSSARAGILSVSLFMLVLVFMSKSYFCAQRNAGCVVRDAG